MAPNNSLEDAFSVLQFAVPEPCGTPSTYMLIRPVDCWRVATQWCHTPLLTGTAEEMVVSGFPTPKTNLPPTTAVPKSFAVPEASPSTTPAPWYHWPVPSDCVVLTQQAM